MSYHANTPREGSATDGSGRSQPTPDTVLELLANSRRRYVLSTLAGTGMPVTVDDLALGLAAWESGTSPAEVDEARRNRLAASLHHVHLPKLSEAGLVAYDPVGKRVQGAAGLAAATPYLEVAHRQAPR